MIIKDTERAMELKDEFESFIKSKYPDSNETELEIMATYSLELMVDFLLCKIAELQNEVDELREEMIYSTIPEYDQPLEWF